MQIKVPATSANLGPGFDCIGMALDLYNYIEYEEITSSKLEIQVDGEGFDNLDKNAENLVYQAFKKPFEKYNIPIPGVRFYLKNNIPLARGLGSSSAAIVGGLVAANTFLENKLSQEELLDFAVKIEGHPDNVAPALLGGIILCTKNKEQVFYKKMLAPSNLSCSVLIPDYELSTKKARDVLPSAVPMEDAVFNIARMGFFINAICTQELDLLKIAIDDQLHQPYRRELIPGFTQLLEKAKELNLLGIAISGAGPTIIVFHYEKQTHLITQLKEVLEIKGLNSKLVHVKPVSQGAEIF